MTIRQLDLLIVVFDSAKARFFERAADERLHPLNEWQSGLHAHVVDLVTDKPGRSFGSTHSGVRHAYESPDDLHKLEKHRFVQRLVKTLDDAYDQGAFKRLLIVAPKRSLGEFNKLAHPKLRALVMHELPKDLTKYPDHELEERLRPHLASQAEPSLARH
ncbi:MAG TPA: host attachment protein [Micropepsaceae bacterium]|nr:host attachment protein [Micropepsaceae bacterium]